MNVDPDECSGSGNTNGKDREPGDGEELPPLVTCKLEYQMADVLSLVLWDCVYVPEDAPWRTDDAGIEGGSAGLHSQLTGLAERAQVEATLAENFRGSSRRHRSSMHRQWQGRGMKAVGCSIGRWCVATGGKICSCA
jgi:hypothetical protein